MTCPIVLRQPLTRGVPRSQYDERVGVPRVVESPSPRPVREQGCDLCRKHGNRVGRNHVGKYSCIFLMVHPRPSKFHTRSQRHGGGRGRFCPEQMEPQNPVRGKHRSLLHHACRDMLRQVGSNFFWCTMRHRPPEPRFVGTAYSKSSAWTAKISTPAVSGFCKTLAYYKNICLVDYTYLVAFRLVSRVGGEFHP